MFLITRRTRLWLWTAVTLPIIPVTVPIILHRPSFSGCWRTLLTSRCGQMRALSQRGCSGASSSSSHVYASISPVCRRQRAISESGRHPMETWGQFSLNRLYKKGIFLFLIIGTNHREKLDRQVFPTSCFWKINWLFKLILSNF